MTPILPDYLFTCDPNPTPDLWHELRAGSGLGQHVIGVDEVGRGPLAGPVVACALCLPYDLSTLPDDIADSKKMTAKKRSEIAPLLRQHCSWAIGTATVEEIDQHNILQATFLAMHRAIEQLTTQTSPADHILIDGPHLPKNLDCPATAVIDGDARSLSIAAASIIAKVERDSYMAELASSFPGYGWEKNAGYGTKNHLQALRSLGVTPHHRRSFAPVACLCPTQ